MVGRIKIDRANRSCLWIGDVQPSVDTSDEAETPEGELHAGDEGDHAEVDRGHQTCGDDLDNNPYLARQLSVFVTGNKIYMVGHRITSVMVAQDARKGRRVLDRFGPSGGGNALRPVCGCIIPVLGSALGLLEVMVGCFGCMTCVVLCVGGAPAALIYP